MKRKKKQVRAETLDNTSLRCIGQDKYVCFLAKFYDKSMFFSRI